MTTLQPTNEDRPRPGANQTGAGSPITQQRAQESTSMTDTQQNGGEWVPRIGKLELAPERTELIRGLYQLAAWVADHPELPLPQVQATVFPTRAWSYDESPTFQAECGVVDRVAAALHVSARTSEVTGHYKAEAWMGPVEVTSVAITAETLAAHGALMSYRDSVQPDQATAGGAR